MRATIVLMSRQVIRTLLRSCPHWLVTTPVRELDIAVVMLQIHGQTVEVVDPIKVSFDSCRETPESPMQPVEYPVSEGIELGDDRINGRCAVPRKR